MLTTSACHRVVVVDNEWCQTGAQSAVWPLESRLALAWEPHKTNPVVNRTQCDWFHCVIFYSWSLFCPIAVTMFFTCKVRQTVFVNISVVCHQSLLKHALETLVISWQLVKCSWNELSSLETFERLKLLTLLKWFWNGSCQRTLSIK